MSLPRVFGWLADTHGCGYYRIMLPLCELARRGVADTAFNARMLAEYATGARLGDVRVTPGDEPAIVIGQRVANPVPSETWQALARDDRFRLVYDIDDDLLCVDPANAKAHEFFSQVDVRRRLVENLAVANLVTVSTEPLAERMRQYADNVVVVGNYLDAAMLDYPAPDTGRALTIGWAGSATHHGDFAAVSPALREFYRRRTGARWHSFGHDYGPSTGAVLRRFTPWRDIVADLGAYCASLRFDIGVAPLADTRFNQAKSDLKAREYAARGIPIVASDLLPYAGTVRHGETGFLVSARRQWVRR